MTYLSKEALEKEFDLLIGRMLKEIVNFNPTVLGHRELKSFISQIRQQDLEYFSGVLEERFKAIPSGVQCRVATDCNYCMGRTDVSYHDCLSDLLSHIKGLENK